jgi:CrcB protein
VSDDEFRDGRLPVDPDIDARPPHLVMALVVFVGGCAGGLSRYAIGRRWPSASGAFPWDTFWVNLSGAFALAVVVTLIIEAARPRWFVRPLLGTGFIGAYTTFSALVTSTDLLAEHGHFAVAMAYSIGSIFLGSASVLLGFLLARWIAARRWPRQARSVR